MMQGPCLTWGGGCQGWFFWSDRRFFGIRTRKTALVIPEAFFRITKPSSKKTYLDRGGERHGRCNLILQAKIGKLGLMPSEHIEHRRNLAGEPLEFKQG